MMRALLIDGGQSGCRAAVIDHGRTVATTTLGGLPRQGRDYAVLRPLLAARGAAHSPGWDDAVAGGVDVVAAGLTGFAGEAAAVASAVPAPTVLVTNDAVTAHLGALAGEPGVVIVAGTGVIALAVGEDEVARADGWGTRLGDDGGGDWIGRGRAAAAVRAPDGSGRAGLAAAWRAHDGRGGSPELLARAAARFGAAPTIVAAVYDARDPVAAI